MLLTPHIVRAHDLRQQDINPIYIGTQQNLGLAGPPPLIARSGARAPLPASPRRSGAPGQPAPAPGATGTLPQPGVVPQTPPAPPTHAAAAAAATRRRSLKPRQPPMLQPEPSPHARDARGQREAPAAWRSAQMIVTHAGHRVPRRRRALHGADLGERSRRASPPCRSR